MYKKLRMKMLAVRIEWHWGFIMRGRKKGNHLLEKGPPYTSDKILRLSKRVDRHCNSISRLTNKYIELAKNDQILPCFNMKGEALCRHN
ncbi:MAG TPA: hypothetical protein PKA28_04570 [Methylomusa anaerophila]|jgi:hypothetical protein|uniref:Uncharacterized protein n=1 Tax=Methylomusa anaerophila TaxID=1930071 RepID=A0A348AN00_9FIRM|nr:hypothetical protein [Methylomusa anaerophila]BBB92448.1 hypothetical protein MAMMFC1_03141 [Methylomusa anaerophila]HML87702.1 hypothetical protein [Methylomusa anaerophila]